MTPEFWRTARVKLHMHIVTHLSGLAAMGPLLEKKFVPDSTHLTTRDLFNDGTSWKKQLAMKDAACLDISRHCLPPYAQCQGAMSTR